MDNRYEIAEQNGMSRDFADWFFDNKKPGCGNVWFMMMAAMWEGWQGRAAMLRGAEKTEPLHAVKDAPALDSSSRIAEPLHADFQGAEPVTTAYKLPEGWVAVPVEPTKEMIDAGWSYYMTTKSPSSLGVYGAMLAATPQQDV
ncbi:hypothetical protein KKZ48_09480 [Enterobacter hormaechei subsp. xiangfangensis]|nr:hypothetical protein [Enterobacter hormaechei subsp. xiangfangensis]MBT2094921.1 hypothetical protein [Enterobacter hormaechei subsp. xiangfangensis]